VSTRREFLKQSALVSLSPLVPAFLSRSVSAADANAEDRVLVVIQLDGGNDGLNTVIPYADENYARFRRELKIKPQEVLKLDDAVGLHPQMKAAAGLFEDGRLAIVQGVGYPNPNRSHFESMAIWHHARTNRGDHDRIGWLGRAADATKRAEAAAADAVYIGAEAVPVALRGRRANAVSLEHESDLKLAADVVVHPTAPSTSDLSAFVERTVEESFQAARRFGESTEAAATGDGYPGSKLARKLRLISRLLKLGGGTRIYYASQSGYDTHSTQGYQHSQLLSEFSGALKAFLNDVRAAGLEQRVVVLAFSEFGRRVEENGSAGTDHGAAGPVFLAGTPVRGGLLGRHPPLDDLDEGDLKMSIDFRQVYATLLTHWLRADAEEILGKSFAPIECMKASSLAG
jgi:uncharacterized protein (DUF1501 family)